MLSATHAAGHDLETHEISYVTQASGRVVPISNSEPSGSLPQNAMLQYVERFREELGGESLGWIVGGENAKICL